MQSSSSRLKILLNSLRVPRKNRFRFPRRGRLCDSGAAQNDATAMPASAKPQRFTYIDWLRGFACLLMFQVHAYDSWLSPSARETKFFKWSQLSGTLPAPMFLFLAGVSFALVTDKLRRKGVPANEIARKTILRGAEILALGYGFRLQEYLLGLPWAPWTDLLRVDILNTIGFSMILMGVVCWFARTRMANLVLDRKSTRLNSSHLYISYAVFCLKKKTIITHNTCASNTLAEQFKSLVHKYGTKIYVVVPGPFFFFK